MLNAIDVHANQYNNQQEPNTRLTLSPMIDDTLYFLRVQLSVGSMWQNIAMYGTLALLAKLITIQYSLLKARHKADTPPPDNDAQDA